MDLSAVKEVVVTLPGFEAPPPVEERGWKRTQTNRRARQSRYLEHGRHPLNGLPLREPEGETCGTCVFLFRSHHGFAKCHLKNTASEATDIKASWPACSQWTTRPAPEHCDQCARWKP